MLSFLRDFHASTSLHNVYIFTKNRYEIQKVNRPFPSCFEPHYESEAKCKVFVKEISFHSYANKTNFHMNSFAFSLACIVRFTATRKWSIAQVNCCLLEISLFVPTSHQWTYQVRKDDILGTYVLRWRTDIATQTVFLHECLTICAFNLSVCFGVVCSDFSFVN